LKDAYRIKKVKIPLSELKAGEVLPFTLLNPQDQVLLSRGQIITSEFVEKLKEDGYSSVLAEILEEDEGLVAKEDISPEIKKKTLENMQEILEDLSRGETPSIVPLEQNVSQMAKEVKAHEELVIPLIQLKKHDDLTFTHSLNVAVISLFIAKFLGLKDEELIHLGLGALLHDLGKLLIPPEILNKPSKLSEKDYEIIQKHTIFAKNILDEKTRLPERVKEIPLQHHERIDGSGYILRLTKEETSVLSRITAVADVYEALTSDRPYRKALPIPEVIEYLMGSAGHKLDDEVVTTFIRHLSPYQVGDLIKLSTGEEAMVSKINPVLPFRPVIRIKKQDEQGNVYFSEEIDLSYSLTLTIIGEIDMKSQIDLERTIL